MSLFSNQNHGARDVRRQMKLAELHASDREAINAAERAASAIGRRLDELTKAGRDGGRPIEGADAAELDALMVEADHIAKSIDMYDHILTSGIMDICYGVRRSVSAERNRRYKARTDELLRLNGMQADFSRPLTTIGNCMEGFVAALDAYPIDVLMGPCEVLSGAPQPVDDVTAESARELDDKALEAAISRAYMQAHAGTGVAYYADEVAQMAEVLPKVAEAMRAYREKAAAKKQRAAEARDILVAERDRRKRETSRIAEREARPVDERIAELEKMVASLRESA